jgi:hypothetical protein
MGGDRLPAIMASLPGSANAAVPRKDSRAAALLLLFPALLCACLSPRSASAPLATSAYPALRQGAVRRLVVLLPGRRSRDVDFEREGFVSQAREAGIDADLVAVDLREEYYRQGVFQQRLWEDVIAPAEARGYGEIWVVGISLGGAGALGVAMQHAGSLRGILLLSPFLGPADLTREIAAAGGLERWDPGSRAVPDPFEAFFRSVWSWLKMNGCRAEGTPPVYLGYGRSDRLSPSLDLLAAAMPQERVLRLDGGHEWKTWRSLWAEFLSRGVLPRTPATPEGKR